MNIISLEKMWKELPHPSGPGRVSIYCFPPECLPELYIGYANGQRSLLLKSSSEFSENEREYITLKKIDDGAGQFISVTLKESYFFDLFNDLILSVYHHINLVKDDQQAANILLQVFNKWAEFFERKNNESLSAEKIQGLMGELKVLAILLDSATPSNINELLTSWRGPYDNKADFVLSNKNIEVKTAMDSRKEVNISSEYQLEKEVGKGIELAVVFMNKDGQESISLHNLIYTLKDRILLLCGDFSIVLIGLGKLGLSFDRLHDYDHLLYEFESVNFYDAGAEKFPKIVRSCIPNELKYVKYKLVIDGLSSFIVSEIKLGGRCV